MAGPPFCRDAAYPHAKFQFPVRPRDRRREASRGLPARDAVVEHVQSVFLFREWSLFSPPPPPHAPCHPHRRYSPVTLPRRGPADSPLVPPFIHEYEIIGNQRYAGHSWRHNVPFVNECALVHEPARHAPGGGTVVVAGGGDEETRGGGRGGGVKARESPGYKLCPLLV